MNSPKFTLLRDPGEPLGLYFRVAHDDHTVLKQILSENRVGMVGAIFDPCYFSYQEDLVTEIVQRNIDAILDTGMMEMAAAGSHSSARQRLPWGSPNIHVPSDFDQNRCELITHLIADFVAAKRFTAVLAPTHFIANGPSDPWLTIDRQMVLSLRQRLNSNGCENVPIYYPLALPMKVLADQKLRPQITKALRGLPINAIWLRIHPFGSHSSDTALQRYILACQQLHSLEVPLVAEKTGVLGLPLLAFSAVAGIECGISSGEKFDFGRLKRLWDKKSPFGRTARVYIRDLGGFLSRENARQLFENRGLRQLACKDTDCCRHGHESMISNSRHHFANSRMGETALLSSTTHSLRPTLYLEEILRPATDNLVRALAHTQLPDTLRKKLERRKSKLDGWRATLGSMSRSRIESYSPTIERRVYRQPAVVNATA